MRFFYAILAIGVFASSVSFAADPLRILNQPYYPTESKVGPHVLFVGTSKEFAERATYLFNQKMALRRMAKRAQGIYSESGIPAGTNAKVLVLSVDEKKKDYDSILKAAKEAGMAIILVESSSNPDADQLVGKYDAVLFSTDGEKDPKKTAEKAEPYLEKALGVP